VVDLIKQSNGTYVHPVLVEPYYGAIGSAFPVGTYNNHEVKIAVTHPTSLGTFETPVPASTAPADISILFNGAEIGNFGIWAQQITNLQYNYGAYFAGEPTTYTNPSAWTNYLNGTFVGKATGFFRAGYKITSAQGNVTIDAANGTLTIQFNISDEVAKLNYCKGITKAGPQGFTLDCVGSGSDNLYSATYKVTVSNFDIAGDSQGLFFSQNAAVISGMLLASNDTAAPDTGADFVIAFGACNQNFGTKCTVE
jgi:hypothetical protein